MNGTRVSPASTTMRSYVKGRLVLVISACRLQETFVVRVYVANGMVYTLAVRGPRVKANAPDALKYL